MPAQTYINVTDASGNFLFSTSSFLEIGNAPGLHYVLSCGNVGALTVTLGPEYNPLLLKDARIHVMRSVNGGPAQREGESCFLIRRWDYADNYTTVTAVHANDLMRRRHILYSGNNAAASYVQITSARADDTIKTLWKQNAGALVSFTARAVNDETSGLSTTQADISAYVSTQANVSAAPLIDKWIPWRNLMDVILEIEDTSYLLGTFLTTEIVAPTESTLELRTYTGIRGVDRRFSSGNGLLFTSARGNLENAILTVDAIEEITMAQAIGSDGTGGGSWYRFAGSAEDDTRMAESPLNRVEAVFDSGDAPADGTLTNDATAAVRAGRPVITALGDLVETDQCIRGVHFNYGDLVTVQVQGVQYDMRLDQLDVTISGGTERTQARFQYNG